MRLKMLLPSRVLVDEEVSRVTAEGEEGSFGVLPRHIDYVSALVPGILSFVTRDGREEFLAVDEGVLVKAGSELLVSVRNAVRGADLGRLRERLDTEFRSLDEHERRSRSAIARLEAGIIRKFVEQE